MSTRPIDGIRVLVQYTDAEEWMSEGDEEKHAPGPEPEVLTSEERKRLSDAGWQWSENRGEWTRQELPLEPKQSAGSETKSQTTRLRWQDEPPTEPGAYWIDDPRYDDPRLAKVYRDSGEMKAKTLGGGVFTIGDSITFSPSQWAGPIPEPNDPND